MKFSELLHKARVDVYQFIRKQPYGTDEVIDIGRIVVSDAFLSSYPSPKKIRTYYDYYDKHGHFDKPIVVQKNPNRDNSDIVFLRDGYIRFGLAHLLHIKKVPVKWHE